ncbi:hypothetical protein CAPTEDRAFT_109241 [Capitella teleta]|uniref:Sulfatase N-terminal domain-containing protein n=1 Tax=Capitella teleta TaxID=283909 RepID=R7T5F6_CAPTE|nr:hypothetical protein CAPTEDRAFT_109241 [Capitella teleta]|eukprot:ELT88246.1 hypothetical protein CAPTEDRAFT_109241 [Capitella teleta]
MISHEYDALRELLLLQESVSVDEWLEQIAKSDRRPNVLFIVADDLRPEMSAQLHSRSPWLEPSIHTPHLDALASRGVLFRRAYCQSAWCNPSRSSFLTSRRLDTTMVHNNTVYFRQTNPSLVTLPQYFKENGYFSLGMGKVFHLSRTPGAEDNTHSWSVPMVRLEEDAFMHDGSRAWGSVSREQQDAKPLLDELVLSKAKDALNDMDALAEGKPFFMAVGLKKPHLNWYFPERYLQHYKSISSPSPLSMHDSIPDIAWQESYEVSYKKEYAADVGNWSVHSASPQSITEELRRAYFSCVSYIDDLVGQLMQHLEETGYGSNTIVAFIGDHGFHLGEHGIFGKSTTFEVANNVPVILRVPGVTEEASVSDKLIELVDIFPTLADLAGLPRVPVCPDESRDVPVCTEGSSLMPLLQTTLAPWKERVFYQFPHMMKDRYLYCMGYSMRTPRYRYTEWVIYYYKAKRHADWQQSCGVELYDHSKDPHESRNIAEDLQMASVRKELSTQLRAGWRGALPTEGRE